MQKKKLQSTRERTCRTKVKWTELNNIQISLNSQFDGPLVLVAGCSQICVHALIAKLLGSFLVLCFHSCKVCTTFSLIADKCGVTMNFNSASGGYRNNDNSKLTSDLTIIYKSLTVESH